MEIGALLLKYSRPSIALLKYISGKLPHSRLSPTQFPQFINDSFDEIVEYIESYGLKKSVFAPGEKDVYIKRAMTKFGYKYGQFTKIIEGKPEMFFIDLFEIPSELRFDKFLIDSYLLSKFYKDLFTYRRVLETIVKPFTSKPTSLHYLSIPNWRNKSYETLISEVKDVKKVSLKEYEFFKFKKKGLAQDSKVISLVQSVLATGKISSKTIFKLVSSEKLIIVHKYAEGFSDVYNSQTADRKRIKDEIDKIKSRAKIGQTNQKKLDKLELELDYLNKNWITAPVGRTLEKKGFKKLFSRNDGIFFLPLSLIPAKYNDDYESFLKTEIIKEAEEYFASIKDSKYLTEDREELNFIILNHLVKVDELLVMHRNRSLEISSPHLARMLMTSFILTSEDNSAEIYINDVVRNVNFVSRIPTNTKTGQYLSENLESFKSILWSDYKIDIHKPVFLANLSENHLDDIAVKLIAINPNVQKFRLLGLLKDQIEFYTQLKSELDELQK